MKHKEQYCKFLKKKKKKEIQYENEEGDGFTDEQFSNMPSSKIQNPEIDRSLIGMKSVFALPNEKNFLRMNLNFPSFEMKGGIKEDIEHSLLLNKL